MLTASLTNFVDSDDEYFEDDDSALRIFPLTLLSDIPLQSQALQQELLREVPVFDLSLLDAIAQYLLERRSVSRKCVISRASHGIASTARPFFRIQFENSSILSHMLVTGKQQT